MTQDIAFCNYKQELARSMVVSYAQEVLHDYLDGKEKTYAVCDVVQELNAIMGKAAIIPVQLINLGIEADDDWARKQYMTKALDMLTKQIRGELG